MKWDKLFQQKNHKGFLSVRKKLKELGFKKDFKIFNVVGTNGKGSISQYLTDSFIHSGKKVGTFTSPHIFKVNERIKINNKEISNKELAKKIKKLDFSFFETLFIVAMLYFQENNIDIAIIEAGIGGSKDTTKAVPGDYGTVTSIGIDHEDILGNTKIKIANDKSGIINKNMKFFIPNSIDKNLRKYFEKYNYQIINNKSSNYKQENINLAKGITKEFKINPIINEVPFRTNISKKNGFIAIKDVAHNFDGIKASIKYLRDKKIKFDKVVISINKKKWKPEIKKLFINKEIKFYADDDSYYSEKNSIQNLSKEYKNQKKNTLYIGTFRTIKKLVKKEKNKNIIRRVLLGNDNNNFKLNIFMMMMGAIILSIGLIIRRFLVFNIGPMHVSLDWVFFMLFGLFFGMLYGSMFSIIYDFFKMIFITGMGNWMWQYAIIPPCIVIFSSLFKEFVWNKKNNWVAIISIIFIMINIISLTTIIINNATSTYEFKNDHKILMNITYILSPILMLMQMSLLFLYIRSVERKKDNIRRFINSIALTMIIIVIMSWIWGPFAFIGYLNRIGNPAKIENNYLLFLIPRIIKTIPEGLIWSICIYSLYEMMDITTKKMLGNRW